MNVRNTRGNNQKQAEQGKGQKKVAEKRGNEWKGRGK